MKKIIQRILIALILLISIFLIYSNLKINGVWLGTSIKVNSTNSDNESALIFDFFNRYEMNVFKPIDSIDKRFYLKFGNYLLSKPIDEFETVQRKIKIDNNKLIIANNDFQYEYIKLPDSLKSNSNDNIELPNKFFILKNGSLTDSIFFGEKIMIRKKYNDFKNKIMWSYDGYWKIENIKGFKIFLGDFSPLVIKTFGEQIKLYQYYNDSFEEIELEEFNEDYESVSKIIDEFNKND